MGFSPKARRYVKAGAKITKATASISARKAETKRTQTRYGYKSPEAATKARKAGALHYESAVQGRRVEKARDTAFLKRLHKAGQERQGLAEHVKGGAIKRRDGKPVRFKASPDNAAYVATLRRRKLSGEMLDQGEWFMMMNYSEALGDPALHLLRSSTLREANEDFDYEAGGEYYDE